MKTVYKSLLAISMVIFLSGCESDNEKEKRIYQKVLNSENIKNQIKNEIINKELSSLHNNGESKLINEITLQLNKQLKNKLIKKEKEKVLNFIKKNKKLRRQIYKEAKNKLYSEYKLDSELNIEVKNKVLEKLEREEQKRMSKIRKKELERKHHNKRIQATISSIDILIGELTLAEEKQYPQICESIYNFSVHETGSLSNQCTVSIKKGRFKNSFSSQVILVNKYVTEGELKDILKAFNKYDNTTKRRINMVIKFKELKEKYLSHQETLIAMHSKLKVAQTLDGSSLRKMQKQLVTTMRKIDKEIATANVY